ncbi:MAG: FHA domain-containing protein [Polyangiaceae bacterium]
MMPSTGFPPPQQGGPAPGAPQPGMSTPANEPAPGAAVSPTNRTLRGFLVAYQSNTQGEFWPLSGGRVGVGRANSGENLDIQLPDPTISSKHAALLVDNVSGAIHVEDTGSTNGTYVNDEHLGFNGRRELKDGDRVRFGGFTTIVKIIGRV